MATDGQGRGLRERAGWLALALIAVGALLVRLPALTAGLPYTSYIDEFAPIDAATHQIHEGTWDPGRYEYPAGLAGATTVVGGLLALATGEDLAEGARISQESELVYVLEPPQLILGGRLVVLAMGVAMVVGIGLVGRELGRVRVGLVAAALAGVLPAFVSRGSVLITDTPVAALTTLALLASAKVANERSVWRWGAVGGAAAGLALGFKYTGAATILLPSVVVAWRSDLSWATRARAGGVVVGTAAVAAVVANPAYLLAPGSVRDGIEFLRRVYDDFASSPTLWEQLLRDREVGPLVVLAAGVGVVAMALGPRTRKLLVAQAAAAVPSLIVLLSSGYQPLRNALPLLPFLCVAVGVGVDAVVVLAARAARVPHRLVTPAVLVVGAVLALVVAEAGVRGFVADQRHLVDSRVEARRWVQDHVEPGDRVLVAEQLAFLPRELALIDAEVVVVPQRGFEVDAETGDDWDLVVAGALYEQPLAWAEELSGREQLATFGRLLTSCPSGLRGTADDPGCPQAPVPRAWYWNEPQVRIFGPDERGP